MLISLQRRRVWYILLQYLSLYALIRLTVYVWLTEVSAASFRIKHGGRSGLSVIIYTGSSRFVRATSFFHEVLYLFLFYVRNSHRFHCFSIRRTMIHIYSSQFFRGFLFCRLLEDDYGILQVNFEFVLSEDDTNYLLQLLIRKPPEDSHMNI